ncbi:2Fe-2S iron-sulfur cluster-binding protein [Bdellovibrio sp. HCB337]|uniref:2Fe-2S iron-sulfur cluster-binding protein n=1 Tax=Bdellovibrio sp. HCB337 TaxID=3394358 RepID=UPI0039A691F7
MKAKFVPQNIELEVNPNKSLLQIATENQIEIRSICKGVPSCAECRVRVVEGENNVLPPAKAELNLIGTNWRIDGRRLSCQMRCYGDVTIDMTEQIEKQENQTKKVRGFRSQKQVESHAVQDTMLLSEKPDDRPEQPQQRAEGQQQERSEQKQQQQGQRQQQQPRNQQQGQQRRDQRNDQRRDQKQGQQQQQGRKPDQKHQNQNQNKNQQNQQKQNQQKQQQQQKPK